MKLLTVRTVSERLAMSISGVYQLISYGELKAIRTGRKKGLRITENDLNSFVDQRKIIGIGG